MKTDWEGWNDRPLADEPIVRLILDGTLGSASASTSMSPRRRGKATTICLLVVLGIRADGQKVLLAVKNACPREGGDGRRDRAGLAGRAR